MLFNDYHAQAAKRTWNIPVSYTHLVKAQVPEFVSNGEVSAAVMTTMYIVVPDLETLEKADAAQKQIYGKNASNP